MRHSLACATLCIVSTAVFGQAAVTEITVDYPYPGIFKALHEDLAAKFHSTHPDVRIKFTAPATDYEQANQRILLQSVTGQAPDVTFQGLNRQRVLIDKKIPVNLSKFIAEDKEFASLGLSSNLLKIGSFNGQQYGIPFTISTPIVYVNEDLIKRAGHDVGQLPKTWDGLFTVAADVNKLGGGVRGFHYDWDISGNWLWQALVYSHGGTMMSKDEKRVQFGDEAGLKSIHLLDQMRTRAGMKDVPYTVSVQDFIAGNLAIWVQTTAFLGNVTRQVKDKFQFRTIAYPLAATNGRVPAGGNVAMMLTKDENKQKAAWKYMKFIASPEAATLMVKATGYFPANDKAIKSPEYLLGFYKENENYATALKQLEYVENWYAFPGRNGLRVTDIINDGLHGVVAGREAPDVALKAMASKTQKLLDE